MYIYIYTYIIYIYIRSNCGSTDMSLLVGMVACVCPFEYHCIHICVYMCVCVCEHIYTYVYMCIDILYIYIRSNCCSTDNSLLVGMGVCACPFKYHCIHICVYMCVWVCGCVFVRVYMYVCIYLLRHPQALAWMHNKFGVLVFLLFLKI